MNTSFDIRSSVDANGSSKLLVEISWQSISFLLLNDQNDFVALLCYHFSADADEESIVQDINKIISSQPVLDQEFSKVSIVYSFSESILVPKALYDESNNDKTLQLVYGDLKEKVIQADYVTTQALYNVYEVPKSIYRVVHDKFDTASHIHLYSLLMDCIKNEATVLYCIFGVHHVTVMYLKDSRLQVIQNFCYKSPEDASYHLLSVCQSFGANMDEIVLHLTGMITRDSNLYRELYKYFVNIEFSGLTDHFLQVEELKKYPAHYFSHLFSVTACV